MGQTSPPRQGAAPRGVHAREAHVHGAVPAPLLVLQDPRPQTRLRRPLRQRPPIAHAHHRGQELPGMYLMSALV